jgi:hypothetical protein
MNQALLLFLGCGAFFSIAVPVRAQSSCTDSLQNPTAALALVGPAGQLSLRFVPGGGSPELLQALSLVARSSRHSRS